MEDSLSLLRRLVQGHLDIVRCEQDRRAAGESPDLASLVAVLPRTRWTWASWAALGVGLIVVLASNVGKQQKFASRARLLWDVLERVEKQAPPGACR